jgi:endoglycosylceramidase
MQHTGETTMMTEFGATNSAPDLSTMVALADQNRVPWLEWAYCGCGDPTTAGPGNQQAIVIDPAQRPTGSNLETTTLRALVEPYPQVVAGTPTAWSFAPLTSTFRLRYSTARASRRGRFRRGTVTEIAAPRLVYHGHYAARVQGGAIVGERGASTLRIAACPHARTIAVTVTPSGRSAGSCRPPVKTR